MAQLGALWICDDISIEISYATLDIYLLFENGQRSTQTRCIQFVQTSVLQQLTFVLLVCFLLTLNTIHTLLKGYYSYFEKVNVGWKCAVNILSK